MPKKIAKGEVIKIIAKILKTTPSKIQKINDLKSVKEWDSLAHLDILSEMDKKLGNKLSNIKNISNITNITKLINILKKKSLLK